ncbi:type III-B CRISPR module-associated protein Cmr5 [Actinomadura algeriensis]|uniref:CRISPR type III-B/RAMP module-associated protein Cmr5 n=1 Tax=Actinomadura algeriensis TaxID=1679523 RepID=A0ABR9JTR1_9ACTN|nr:type III-B CRISPR module-associated protein Cmr5 [Actinomadura algeriensis]MBE1533957.1 CRISPR/Cas system CMR-associated protein Cmr5 small subunit [Actinomadura algeriensis]
MSGRTEQQMAATAAELLPSPVTRELRTRYRALPVMLRTSGLAATYAYIAAKGNGDDRLADAYARVARGIRDRLRSQGLLSPEDTADHRAVLRALGAMDTPVYLRAAAEVSALTIWMSRLADALHQRDES